MEDRQIRLTGEVKVFGDLMLSFVVQLRSGFRGLQPTQQKLGFVIGSSSKCLEGKIFESLECQVAKVGEYNI